MSVKENEKIVQTLYGPKRRIPRWRQVMFTVMAHLTHPLGHHTMLPTEEWLIDGDGNRTGRLIGLRCWVCGDPE